MGRLLQLSVVAIAILSVSAATAAEKWTLMVYLDADSNLHYAGIDDMDEMASCSTNAEVNIIVLFDGQYQGDSKLYKITHNTKSDLGDGGGVIPANGECDMSDENQFDKFVDWAILTYPADNFLLSIWDHGDGIFKGESEPPLTKGVCGGLKLWEIESVLDTASDRVDIVGFDVCNLGHIETGWQLQDNSDYVIASEASEPFDGWDYTSFELVCSNPNTTPLSLVTTIVDDYLSFYGGGVTQAGQDLNVLTGALQTELNAFCTELIANCSAYNSDIYAARSGAWYDYDEYCRDLYEFTENISGDSDLPTGLRNSADSFIAEWSNFIVAGGSHNSRDAHGGATVYFPSNGSSHSRWNTYISNIDFVDTQWDEFLINLANPTAIRSASLGEIKATFK
ncbi:MAG: hypothetical protein GY771_16950 [bacterium]|nr:hypothetical protein [bacterium]